MKTKFNAEQEKSICDMYLGGLNSVEISKILNVSDTPIIKILKKNNILRSRSESHKKIHFTIEESEKIIRLYNDGLSHMKIAELLEYSPSTIYKFLKNNIKMRTISESLKLFLKTPEGHELRSENRKKQIPPMLGKHQTERQKRIVSENNWTKTIEGKLKVSNRTKELWKEEDYRNKLSNILRSVASHPKESNPNWKGGKDIANIKRQEKRKDFISSPLNNKFPNSEEHHIDKQTTIYLPKEIHSRNCGGIIHNLHTGYCMNVINTISYFFLIQQNIQKLNKYFNGED